MEDLLDGLPLGGLGWAGIATVVLLAIVRGFLVPRVTHEREVAILEKQAEAAALSFREQLAAVTKVAEDWHEAYDGEREARTVQGGQLAQILDAQRAQRAVFDALRRQTGIGIEPERVE